MSMKDPKLEQAGEASQAKEKWGTPRGTGRGTRPAANTAYKYRIYPNKNQALLIAKTIGCCRLYWNLSLEDREWAWQQYQVRIQPTHRDYKADERYAFFAEVDQQAFQNVRRNLEQAIQNHIKNPQHFELPKKKKRRGLEGSYTTNAHYYRKVDGTDEESDISIDYKANTISLPKLGAVPIRAHRKLPDGAIVKNATVSRDSAGHFFVSVGFFDPELDRLLEESGREPQSKQEILCTGLDYSSANLFVNELGNMPGQVKQYAKYEHQLARRQRQLSRKQKGSRNYYKKLKQINKLHRRIANCRADFLHKLALAYARTYDVVCVETLNMQDIGTKHFHLGKSTYDNAWGMFLRILSYKMKRRGGVLVRVDRWFPSSKMCSKCGNKYKELTLSERKWTCSVCGAHHDRDMNAAWNILVEGVRMLVDGEVTWEKMIDIGGVSSYTEAMRENEKRIRKNEQLSKQGKPPVELLDVPARISSCLPEGASCFVSAGGTPVTAGNNFGRSPGNACGSVRAGTIAS